MDSNETAERIASIERQLKKKTLRPGRRVELGYMLLLLKKGDKAKA